MLNYKLNKESIEFLFDNGFLNKKFNKACIEFEFNMNEIQSYLENNLVETKKANGETFKIYDSFFCSIVEYHFLNIFDIY